MFNKKIESMKEKYNQQAPFLAAVLVIAVIINAVLLATFGKWGTPGVVLMIVANTIALGSAAAFFIFYRHHFCSASEEMIEEDR